MLTPEQQQAIESFIESANKLAGKLCPGDDEARSIAYLALCEAIQTYQDSMGMTIRTWCLNHAKWAIQQYKAGRTDNGKPGRGRWRKDHRVKKVPLDKPGLIVDTRDHGIELFEIEDLLRVLPTTQREIFRRIVLEGWSVIDIVRGRGISKSRVYKILSKCKERLRREIDGDSPLTSDRV